VRLYPYPVIAAPSFFRSSLPVVALHAMDSKCYYTGLESKRYVINQPVEYLIIPIVRILKKAAIVCEILREFLLSNWLAIAHYCYCMP
jgi:hypothetical protein